VYNNTRKSWILSRDIPYWRFGKIEEQNRILAAKSKKEGFTVVGYSNISEPINRLDSMRRIQELITAAKEKKIDALFVFSIRHISENLEITFRFIDRMNSFGVVVYDIDGYTYSHDWVCKQIGKRFIRYGDEQD